MPAESVIDVSKSAIGATETSMVPVVLAVFPLLLTVEVAVTCNLKSVLESAGGVTFRLES